MAVSGMVIYEQPFSTTTFILVLATLVSFVIGASLAGGSRAPHRPDLQAPDPACDRTTIGVLCALAGIGVFWIVKDLYGGGFAVLTNFTTESSRVRNDFWDDFASGNVDVSPVRSVGIVSCLALATLFPYATRFKLRFLQVASAIGAVVVVLDSFLLAGRFSLAVLALCLLVSASLVYGGQSLRRILTVRRLTIGGLLCFYFFVVFPTQRNPLLAGSVERSLRYSGDAHFSDWVKSTSEVPGMSWLEVFAYSTSYFSTSLDKLNFFVTDTSALSWYRLGLYNFTQASQVSGAFSDSVTPWQQTRLDIAAIMRYEGWGLNPWSTGIRDLGIDFGLFGILFVGLLGFVARKVYDRSLAGKTYIGLIAASYVSISCLIFAFISPFQIRVISNGFWLLALLLFVRFSSRHFALRRATSGGLLNWRGPLKAPSRSQSHRWEKRNALIDDKANHR
ncbi:O-antigen polymerase [Mycolicibacterium psychrotolerans]|uniref:O-antigen polymerase n=1 Tax=Mycolicibacterium psychrotolerans TaxID=216929 RepID=UPI0013D6A2B4|nr:O-antigen polymerase [Mycolicibacterium psychrotolerans]